MPFFFQRRFLPMWTAFVLGAFTDNMLKQALLIGLTFNALITLPWVSDGSAIVPLAGALFPLAMFLFSPIAGQVADRYETRWLFSRTKLAEFFLMALAGTGFLLVHLGIAAFAGPVLVLALFLMGVQSAFFSPVRIAAMPKYLKPDELIRGNALCNGGLYTSILVGLVLGGGLITLSGGALIVGFVLAGAAFIGWLVIRLSPAAAADAPGLKIDLSPIRLFIAPARHVAAEPAVLRPMLGIGLFFFISTAVTIAVPLFAEKTLNADGAVATAIMGLFAIGALVGAIVSALLSKGRSGLGFATFAMGFAAFNSVLLFFISAGFEPGAEVLNVTTFFARKDALVLAGLFVLSAASMGVFTVPLQAAVQRRAKSEHRARIMSAGNMLNALTAGIGSLSVSSITATALSPHGAFLAIAVLQAAIAGYMIWRRQTAPAGLYDDEIAAVPPPGDIPETNPAPGERGI